MTEVDRTGNGLLVIGLLQQASAPKITYIVAMQHDLVKQRFAGRLPLHIAIENFAPAEVLRALIEHYEEAVAIQDRDLRFPLHMLFEYDNFDSNLVSVIGTCVLIHPHACSVRGMGKLPLHMALDKPDFPHNVVVRIISCYRAGASAKNSEGWLPLHTAVYNNLDPAVVSALVRAHPAALLKAVPRTDMTVLEFAMKTKKPKALLECLIYGGPLQTEFLRSKKLLAACRSVSIGQVSRPYGGDVVVTQAPQQAMVARGPFDGMPSMPHQMDSTLPYNFLASDGADAQNDPAASSAVETANTITLNLVIGAPEMGYRTEIEVQQTWAIAKVKSLIERRISLPVSKQRLLRMRDKKQLMSNDRVEECGLERMADVNVIERVETLHYAIKGCAKPKIQLALLKARPAAASEEDSVGNLPLQLAIVNGSPADVVEKLVDQYPRAVFRGMGGGKLGEYPLHRALDRPLPVSVISRLLDSADETHWSANGNYNPRQKASLEQHQAQCGIPLHIAIKRGDVGTVEQLLAHRCPIEARDRRTGSTALECVLSTRDLSEGMFETVMAATLVQNPAAIETPSANGLCPLHVAVQNGSSVHIVQELMQKGPHVVSQTDAYGNLPLHLAIQSGANFSVVRQLMMGQPQAIYYADRAGRTPLLLAILHRAAPGVVFEIGRYDARGDGGAFEVKDTHGRGVLELAVQLDAPLHILNEILACNHYTARLSLLSTRWPDNAAARHALHEVMRTRMAKNEHGERAVVRQISTDNATPTAARSPCTLSHKQRTARGPAVVVTPTAKQRRSFVEEEEPQPTSFMGAITSLFGWT